MMAVHAQLTDQLRKLTKQVQDCRAASNEEGVRKAVAEYDDYLERYMRRHTVPFIGCKAEKLMEAGCSLSRIFCYDSYIPALMAQANIYWMQENYTQVEKIFRKSVEFCSEHDDWKLNVAHVLFMQVYFGSGRWCVPGWALLCKLISICFSVPRPPRFSDHVGVSVGEI